LPAARTVKDAGILVMLERLARRRSWIARSVSVIPILVVVWGVAYVRVAEWMDRRRFPQVGQSVRIGERALNLYCSGSGTPTVIFESGFGQPGYTWQAVQPKVAESNRACWYDRAGNGWSGPASGPRWSDSVATDLHRLLAAARVFPPYILVGHSLGGFHVRVFNARFPQEVVGLVLIDPSNEDIGKRITDMPHGGPPPWLPSAFVHTVDFVVMQTGLWRWFMRDPGPRPAVLTDRDWELIASLRRQRKMIEAESREAPEARSAEIARAAGHLDSVPLIVLTRGKPFFFPDTARGNRLLEQWIELSGELAHRSSRGKQVIVRDADHFIQYDAPDAVVAAIREVATTDMLRSVAPNERRR
jgi:pimeloyl-ACP methyl ester carboxylesterase